MSPNKICFQFNAPEAKARVIREKKDELIKLPNCDRALPITPQGVEVGFISVGMRLDVVKEMQRGLVQAYKDNLDNPKIKELFEDLKWQVMSK